VRELTPREPVWAPGEFVDTPIVTKGAVPHWSRWERSSTTMGPVGRIVVTVVAISWVLSAATQSPITLIFVVPLVGLIVREVWRRGWVIPPDRAATPPATPHEPVSAWLWDRSEFLRSVVLAIISLLGVGILLYAHDDIVRFIVVVTGLVGLGFWLWRVADGAR
jgi:hypothetical protein